MKHEDNDPQALRLGGSGELLVRFAETRDVTNTDGNFLGRTNKAFGLSTGQHTVTLAGNDDFAPATQKVSIVAGQVTVTAFERQGI